MKKIITFLLFSLLGLTTLMSQNLTPRQVLEKTVREISSSKGVSARFTITNSGYSSKGEIKVSGEKFKVIIPDTKIWYNGKDLYTYNENTDETTIVKPTSEELAESNPLAYVTDAGNNFNVSNSTVKKTGSYVLELKPKTKGDVKRITLTVNKVSFIPERIVIEPMMGSPIRADIYDFKKGGTFNPIEFEYPSKQYPKAEIVDLR